MTKRARQLTAELKAKAVKESLANGATIRGVAAKYGVSTNSLQAWRRLSPQPGATASPRGRIRAPRTSVRAVAAGDGGGGLSMENNRLRGEIQILRDIIVDQELRLRGFPQQGRAQAMEPMVTGAPQVAPNGSALHA